MSRRMAEKFSRHRLGRAAALGLSAFVLFGQGALAAPERETFRSSHTIELDGDLEFRDNVSTPDNPLGWNKYLGAAISCGADLTITGTGSLSFYNNGLKGWSEPYGGAIFTQKQLSIDIDGDITAKGNYSLHEGTSTGATGSIRSASGAFHANSGVWINANNLLFEDNHSGHGGAVCAGQTQPITLITADSMTLRLTETARARRF